MYKFIIIPVFLTLVVFPAFSQSSPTTSASVVTAAPSAATTPIPITTPSPGLKTEQSGLLSYVDFGGSSNSTGHIFTLGLSAGYQFNDRVSVDARVPFYFVSATTTTTGTGGGTQQSTLTDHGIGDPSFALTLRFPNHVLDYKTRVTTWVPVARVSSGFSTGSVLVDWANRFSRPIGRLLPFGQIDLANTVPDTAFFLLPYTAKGFNARFEGGTQVALTKIFSVGGSAYYVAPSGQQHLYSRVCDSGSGSGGTMGGGTGWNENGFLTNSVTVGDDLTRDHGFSTWLTANLPHYVDLEIGFTRSYDYNLNTVSFGVGFDPLEALRHKRH